ncbi:hypothetical protein AOY20_02065 [Acinetobacter equi]|uniref:Uncharacterized protein n=2 Tax=Acinetobacter equi TaxID=1324350 RepID=A0A0N9WAN0_9GAMM|nr:hypothetical protein AOY20_02065 [Acinetobacter equi]
MSLSTVLWAETITQEDSSGLISPYGQNPNIFHVFAYKTQEGIKNTANRVGSATERGFNKLKPKAKQAEEGIERTAQAAGQKITDAKNAVLGDPADGPAPIVQQPLEQSSKQNNSTSQTYPISDL